MAGRKDQAGKAAMVMAVAAGVGLLIAVCVCLPGWATFDGWWFVPNPIWRTIWASCRLAALSSC